MFGLICASVLEPMEIEGFLFFLMGTLKVTLAIVIAYDWFHGE